MQSSRFYCFNSSTASSYDSICDSVVVNDPKNNIEPSKLHKTEDNGNNLEKLDSIEREVIFNSFAI